MIKHIVFFRLKKENKEENIQKLKLALLGLKDKIEIIQDLEVGLNFNEKPSAFDISLIVDLTDKESLEIYRVHPEHQKVVELIKEINDEAVVVDYEV